VVRVVLRRSFGTRHLRTRDQNGGRSVQVVVGQFECDLHGKMHFSIPDTVELKDKNGSNYLVSMHVVCRGTISQFVLLAKGGSVETHLFSFIV